MVEVVLLNPYNEREFLGDKLSVVDVKARDEAGRIYQVEIQLLVLPDLPARILYGWADLYSAQLASGQDYGDLKPTYAIWLLGETLLADRPGLRAPLSVARRGGTATWSSTERSASWSWPSSAPAKYTPKNNGGSSFSTRASGSMRAGCPSGCRPRRCDRPWVP